MSKFTIEPKVDTTQEFIEIAHDFSNPLDIVREAISNSFDADANKIEIYFRTINEYGNRVLQIELFDNGKGMNKEELQAFFDLGNSTKRNNKEKIGEKGHGTKVYFNSSEIKVETIKDAKKYVAVMSNPHTRLFERIIPNVDAEETEAIGEPTGTKIFIKGYNNNQSEKFNQNELKDYILWFTKFGSIEKEFGVSRNAGVKLVLKGLDREEPQELDFGHPFPNDSLNVNKLFDQYKVQAPDFFCKKIIKVGNLTKFPEIKFQAVFCIEGNKVKQQYNHMLRRPGRPRCHGDYTVQDRYGLYLSKDYIPVQKKNEWITYKGSEFTKFHAFINCQALRLTANRGSIENTPSEIIEELRLATLNIYEEIVKSDDWQNILWLEDEADAYNTAEIEKRSFDMRISKAQRAKIAEYKNIVLVEPERESGVFSLVVQLLTQNPDIFPFQILDYDTHQGIDVVVKTRSENSIKDSKLYYVEFKHTLSGQTFNHTFENTHSIICWDLDIKHEDTIKDLAGETRSLNIARPTKEGEESLFYLDHPRSNRRIQVYVLKDYLKEKLNLEFKHRSPESKI